MLGASGVEIPQDELDDLHSFGEERETLETVDPQEILGFEWLVGTNISILYLLLEAISLGILDLLVYTIISGLVNS